LAVLDYSTTDYRSAVDGPQGVVDFAAVHDREQASLLACIGTEDLAGRTVADVGCGGGRMLDLLAGFTHAATLAIEPTTAFHETLSKNGHQVFDSTTSAAESWHGVIDLAISFDVIEHVDDPSSFCREIRALVKPGGRVVIGTPNLEQLLMTILPEDFGRFFYRRVHRWYFTARSLEMCLASAGLSDVRVRSLQRYDFANIAVWLRDRRPSGNGAIALPVILTTNLASAVESVGMGEYLVAEATVR